MRDGGSSRAAAVVELMQLHLQGLKEHDCFRHNLSLCPQAPTHKSSFQDRAHACLPTLTPVQVLLPPVILTLRHVTTQKQLPVRCPCLSAFDT